MAYKYASEHDLAERDGARSRVQAPTIHLNGTSKEALVEGYRNAIHALHEAGRELAKTYPNGRDYYPQGEQAIHRAMDEHESRMNRLRGIIGELEEIVMEIF